MQVARHLNEPLRMHILNCILKQLDDLSECMGVLESAVGGGTARIKPRERKHFKLEELPDDVFFIVIDQFDSPSAPFDLYPIRDVKTLCSLRCVNKRFANLLAKCTFRVVTIGAGYGSHEIPKSVIQYARHLTIQTHAFPFQPSHWHPLMTGRIDALRCVGNPNASYWDGIRDLDLMGSFGTIRHLSLDIVFLATDLDLAISFQGAVNTFKNTVRSICLNLQGTFQGCKSALRCVRRAFSLLTYIQFIGLNHTTQYILAKRWASASTVRTLVLNRCDVASSLISQVVANFCSVDDLILLQCEPTDASEGVSFLDLHRDRAFRRLLIDGQNTVIVVLRI